MNRPKKEYEYEVIEELHKGKHIAKGDKYVPQCDRSNTRKKKNQLLEVLYCFVNGKKPSKTDLKIDMNDFTKALIITMMSMEATKKDSFMYRLNHGNYCEITVEQKLDFLRRVYRQLLNLTQVPGEDYLKDYYNHLDLPEGTNLEELYYNDMLELLDEKLSAIADDFYIDEYIKIIEKEIAEIVKCGIEDVYPFNIFGGLLYPKEFSTSTINDVFGCLKSNDVFSRPEFSLLDYDEKRQLLDILKDNISSCIDNWKETVSKVFQGKIEDSSLSIGEILSDSM